MFKQCWIKFLNFTLVSCSLLDGIWVHLAGYASKALGKMQIPLSPVVSPLTLLCPSWASSSTPWFPSSTEELPFPLKDWLPCVCFLGLPPSKPSAVSSAGICGWETVLLQLSQGLAAILDTSRGLGSCCLHSLLRSVWVHSTQGLGALKEIPSLHPSDAQQGVRTAGSHHSTKHHKTALNEESPAPLSLSALFGWASPAWLSLRTLAVAYQAAPPGRPEETLAGAPEVLSFS